MDDLKKALAERILVLDGAVGTELMRRGGRGCLEAMVLDNEAAVAAVRTSNPLRVRAFMQRSAVWFVILSMDLRLFWLWRRNVSPCFRCRPAWHCQQRIATTCRRLRNRYLPRISFSISSIWLLKTLSVSIMLVTALHECSTVAWLRPPMAAPMAASGDLVCCLARYIAI